MDAGLKKNFETSFRKRFAYGATLAVSTEEQGSQFVGVISDVRETERGVQFDLWADPQKEFSFHVTDVKETPEGWRVVSRGVVWLFKDAPEPEKAKAFAEYMENTDG